MTVVDRVREAGGEEHNERRQWEGFIAVPSKNHQPRRSGGHGPTSAGIDLIVTTLESFEMSTKIRGKVSGKGQGQAPE